MRCAECDFQNPAGHRFCGMCGTPLPRRCLACGFDNAPDFRLCGRCGAPLDEDPPPGPSRSVPAESPGEVPRAERRQLTVMFCDMVGSSELSVRLDPEELRELVRSYQEASARVVDRFGGYVAQYLGDGILAYFGYPVAYEHAPEHAVRAGLGILQEIDVLNRRLQATLQVNLAVRIGVHTGLVVVGEVGGGARREQLALGLAPNMAARLQALAPRNTVVVSGDTHRLISRAFDCESLGAHALKGFTDPVEVYRVHSEHEYTSVLDGAGPSGPAFLVGRDAELDLLRDRWERSLEASPQFVAVCGDAGIGKSHLIRAFRQYLDSVDHIRLTCQCSPFYQNSALHPIVELLQRMLNFYPQQPVQERLDMLTFMAERNGLSTDTTIPLLAALLSVPLDERVKPLLYSAQVQREKTHALLLELFARLSEDRPLLLVVEDVHWADPSTLELLERFIEHPPDARILIILTYRPSFQLPWSASSRLTLLSLHRLSRPHIEALVRRVARGKHLPDDVLRQIVAKTDGVPLFVEELTKMVLESGLLHERDDHYALQGPLPSLAIPTSLQDSLMARLDRLDATKELAQLGATLGREFSYALLAAVSPLEEPPLSQALQRLVDAELLYCEGKPPRATYTFKHALIQDVAYESLLKSRRQQFHRQIGHVLEHQFPETTQMRPELLAHHFTAAGLPEKAVPYWRQATLDAVERSANKEAVQHARAGLELIPSLADAQARTEMELQLLLTLGPALITTRGYASSDVEDVYARAHVLSRQAGNEAQQFQALLGLFAFHFVRFDLSAAHSLAGELFELASRTGAPTALVGAHMALGVTFFWFGRLHKALEHMGEGLSLYRRQPDLQQRYAFRFGQDSAVVGLCYSAMALWMLGFPDQALARIHQALALARELAHPHSLAVATNFAGWIHQLRRERAAVDEQSMHLLTLCREQGFDHWIANGLLQRAWVHAHEGDVEQALDHVQAARTRMRRLGMPTLMPIMAEILNLLGQPENGLALMEEDWPQPAVEDRHVWLPEWYRVKGELLIARDASDIEAQHCLERALQIARRHQSRAWELRAALSLSNLLQRRGETEPALALLEPTYNWFTEGHDVADVMDARTFLDRLAALRST